MLRQRVVLLWVALVPCVPGVCADDPVLSLGAHVRVSAPTTAQGPIQGYLRAMDDHAITVTSGKQTLTIPRAGITRLEVSFGKRGHARTGAIVGGGLALVSLVALCADEDCGSEPGYAALFGAGLLVGYGGFGALVGAAIRTDKWVVVPLGAAAGGRQVQLKRGLNLDVALRLQKLPGATAALGPQLVVRF